MNRGKLCARQRRHRKSELIKKLRPKFEAMGYKVTCVAFTHVAVANIDDEKYPARTILHLLHRFVGKPRAPKEAIFVDECGMVTLAMWSALLNVTFTGHAVVVLGDYEGQFTPIQDQHRMDQWERLWNSRFLIDLCRGLRVTLRKYRRKAAGMPLDPDHFNFVGRLYPHHRMALPDGIAAARDKYPAKGTFRIWGTTLCITHKCRISVNAHINNQLAPSNAVFVPATYSNKTDANQPQDMKVWQGLILVARCGSKERHLKHGVRYQVLAITDNDDETPVQFEMTGINDKDERVGESFFMTKEELGEQMRLSHAITYFSSQARTIYGGLRLTQTRDKLFTMRHLIVGLGRGPRSYNIEVD